EQWAKDVDPAALEFRFPRALVEGDELDFSFSGLKTAVLRHVEERFDISRNVAIPGSFHPLIEPGTADETDDAVREIASAFQDAVTEVLAIKGFRAAQKHGVSQLVVCGGVAANAALRRRVAATGDKLGIEPIFPSLSLCTDNAAMIAARADVLLSLGITDNLDFGAKSRW
ncbi:MAG: tRNA (adenosine(37)-N6)-threonylcarbamoyltransferase complex transferase subunit TsaD, partial [Thermodesulfobacteriota bacterium]